MLSILLTKSSSHSHDLSLMIILISLLGSVTIVIMGSICSGFCYIAGGYFSRIVSTTTTRSSAFIIIASILLGIICHSRVLRVHGIITVSIASRMGNCLKLWPVMNGSYLDRRSYCHPSHFRMSRLRSLSTWSFAIASSMAHCGGSSSLSFSINCS